MSLRKKEIMESVDGLRLRALMRELEEKEIATYIPEGHWRDWSIHGVRISITYTSETWVYFKIDDSREHTSKHNSLASIGQVIEEALRFYLNN